MSDQHDQPDPTQPHGAAPGEQPEYLGEVEAPARSGRRWAVIGAASVAVVAAAGVGAWGVAQLMSSGESPASAVPAGAVAYLSVDLDPSATQKIEALRILKKFPAIEKELDLGLEGDLRRWAFEKVQEEGECADLDYGADVEPWLGDRVAVAGVPDKAGEVLPLVVVQVSDAEAAEAGVAKLAACGDEEVATAVVGDYLLVGEDQVEVDVMAADAGSASLQDDADFATWLDRAGSSGIITGYVSPDAVDYFSEAMADAADSGEFGPGAGENVPERIEELYAGFEGAAMVVRFADGGVEAKMVSSMPADYPFGQQVPGTLSALPSTTALAFSFGVPKDWVSMVAEGLAQDSGQGVEEMWAELSAMSGLDLPADAETLLGRGMTFAMDSDFDVARVVEQEDATAIPIAVQLTGDAPEMSRVLDRLRGMAGPVGELVVSEESGDTVTVGVSPGYVSTLAAGEGDLGSTESFRRVVAEADRADGVFYVDFDAADRWLEFFAAEGVEEARELRSNLAPLDAAGGSGWRDGDVYHMSFRLSTD